MFQTFQSKNTDFFLWLLLGLNAISTTCTLGVMYGFVSIVTSAFALMGFSYMIDSFYSGEIVFIESPYSGDIDRNIRYLGLVMMETGLFFDQLPYASHAYMTQHPVHKNYFVCDYNPKWDVLRREQAINMAQRMRYRCNKTIFYTDLGWSNGMKDALQYCIDNNLPYEERRLDVERLAERIPVCTKEFMNAIIEKREYEHLLQT